MPQTTQDKSNVWTLVGDTFGPPINSYRHGDTVVVDGLATASNTSEVAFSGGLDGIVETLSVGATISDGNGWLFTTSADSPVVFDDPTRGKVMYSDYLGANSLDASKTYTFSTPVPENTDFYSSRWVRAEILTTGGVVYPDDKILQWKLSRDNYSPGISDDSDTNTGQEIFAGIFYNSNGRQVRIENNAGLETGTITSGSTTTIVKDTSKSWFTNWLNNRIADVRKTADGTHQVARITDNASNQFTLVNTITAPIAGDTYSIGTMQDYYGLTGLVPKVNSGWFMQERFINTGTQGQPNGSYTIRYRQGGVVVDDTKSGICLYGGTKRFIYPYHQDYFGNNEVAMTSKKSFSDDIFAMSGTNKRLVLCSSLNINTCVTYELQKHTSWTGNRAIFKLNRGACAPGTYYICEVSGVNTILSYRSIKVLAG